MAKFALYFPRSVGRSAVAPITARTARSNRTLTVRNGVDRATDGEVHYSPLRDTLTPPTGGFKGSDSAFILTSCLPNLLLTVLATRL